MSVAYSDFFASGLRNTGSRSRNSTMSLDIPRAISIPDATYGLSGTDLVTDSPLLRSPIADESDVDTTPTNANMASGAQQPVRKPLRKRRSSLSLAVGSQGNLNTVKSPARAAGAAFQASRSRSGSTASCTSPAIEVVHENQTVRGRGRSGSMGNALRANKRRSFKATLAPPLPPPKSPLPDLPMPSFASFLGGLPIPGSAPPDMTSFPPAIRSPLAERTFPSQASLSPRPIVDAAASLKSSPIRESFDLERREEDIWMKEN